MKRLLILGLSVMIVISIFVPQACLAAEEQNVINFGVATPLSGGASNFGIPHLRGIQLGADRVNQAGGLSVGGKKYTIKVIGYDTKYNIAEATSVVKKLVLQDKVQGLSILGGGIVGATMPIHEKADIVGIHMAWMQGMVSPAHPFTFSGNLSPPELAQLWPGFRKLQPDLKTIAIINTNDEVGWMGARWSKQYAEQAGLEVVATEFFVRTTLDFTPILRKVLRLNPSGIDMLGMPASSEGLIEKQARELGYKGHFYNSGNGEALFAICGKEALEGEYTSEVATANLPPSAQSWMNDYKAKFGTFEAYSLKCYNFIASFVAGIKKADSIDPTKIKEALEGGAEWDALWGGKAHMGGLEVYGINHQAMYRTPISQYQNGAIVVTDYYMPR